MFRKKIIHRLIILILKFPFKKQDFKHSFLTLNFHYKFFHTLDILFYYFNKILQNHQSKCLYSV